MGSAGAPKGPVWVYVGKALARYGFPHGHPFGPDRLEAFWSEARRRGLDGRVAVREPVRADRADIARFHHGGYIDQVIRLSEQGSGFLDLGDTPVFPGIYEAAATVVGSVSDALNGLMTARCRRAFVPIAGLHHAARDRAAGFCVFNDCGVAIETLKGEYGLKRIAYVDIDAHHGDGVYYAFESDPAVWIADIHQDGRTIFPGTGAEDERGRGGAEGTKLNLPLAPGSGEEAFHRAWKAVEDHVQRSAPEIILLQCGADSLKGDPITQLAFTPDTHAFATRRLAELAERYASGRLLALGGGGYDRANLAAAWCAVLEGLLDGTAR